MELLLIAFALAMDSVALSISNGAKYPNFKFAQIARVAACYAGKLTGEYLHSKALVLGGAILILIGVKILLSHLGVIDI